MTEKFHVKHQIYFQNLPSSNPYKIAGKYTIEWYYLYIIDYAVGLKMLKTNWERTHHHPKIDENLLKKALHQYSTDKVSNITLLSNGCGNSNYRVQFEPSTFILLRIYLRDSLSLKKEFHILKMLDGHVPVPEMLFLDSTKNTIPYVFSINQFIEGTLMREIVLEGNQKDIEECAYSAGKELAKLKKYKFDSAGFLTENLGVKPFPEGSNLSQELNNMLSSNNAKQYLSKDLHAKLNNIISNHPIEISSCNLVHGDYDPANILVKKINGKYEIAAILDWEFAFSGSPLFDVGNFTRYSHLLSQCYEESFISGLQSNGSHLTPTWKKDAKLMDLLSLLSLLNEHSYVERPNMIKDIISLIECTADDFRGF